MNLNTVADDVLEGLVRYRLRTITCSIDGASRETYAIYRRHGDYDTVLGNIRKINAPGVQPYMTTSFSAMWADPARG